MKATSILCHNRSNRRVKNKTKQFLEGFERFLKESYVLALLHVCVLECIRRGECC